MENLGAALAVTLAVTASLAGCVQDLERRQLDTGWETQVQLVEAPARDVHGAPAQLVVSGPVQLPGDTNVTLTGLDANVTRGNTTIQLDAMRVRTDEGTQRAGDATGSVALTPGEDLSVTFVPGADQQRRTNPQNAWNVSVEVRWKYRAGAQFDAGRLEAQHNLTPERVPDLGVGVVDRSHGKVHGLVFEAIDGPSLPDEAEVTATRIGGGQAETVDRLTATVNASDGTARLNFSTPLAVPEGSGYLVFDLDGPRGWASTGLVAEESPVPGLTAWGAIAALGVALAVRRLPGRS